MEDKRNYERIKNAMMYVLQNFKEQPKVETIAEFVNMSKFHFQRVFKEWAGVSPKKFLQYITLNELKKEVNQTKSIIELSEKVGYSSQSRVYDLFVTFEAVTPQEYKSKGNGIKIEYGIHNSPFGKCLIAHTERGICNIDFIDDNEEDVLQRFKQKWENASIQQNQSDTIQLITSIFTNEANKEVKLLLSGTKFQIKVWEALLKIPYGQLTNYKQIACYLNKAEASRAVGNAIGKNHIAMLIPCHRVIKNIGEIGGYKWNTARKLSLIGFEKTHLTI